MRSANFVFRSMAPSPTAGSRWNCDTRWKPWHVLGEDATVGRNKKHAIGARAEFPLRVAQDLPVGEVATAIPSPPVAADRLA